MGEFQHLQKRRRQPGFIGELRDLSKGAWAAIGGGFLAFGLFLAVIVGVNWPTQVSTAAGPSPYLPMTPTGGYTVGEQAYVGAVPMPNYVGWTVQGAINDLASRGIYLGAEAPGRGTATVVAQNPYPGTRIRQSNASAVQLMVSDAAPTTTTTTTTTTTPEPSPSTDVEVDVDKHHNLPDGALTGGYCRRKWWC